MRVVLVGPYDLVFLPVEQAVRALGHDVLRYRTEREFLGEPQALQDTSVLYAVGSLPVSRAAMTDAPHLRAIISPYTGTEGFDEKAASELGILIGNGQLPENYESMAEATILMMLACLYDLNDSQRRLRESLPNPLPPSARMLKGKTVGLIGFGQIARAVVERLGAWGVNFLIYTPRMRGSLPQHASSVSLEELLSTSDLVCVLAPLNAETHHMLDAQRLALLRPGSIVINTARGGIVDERALYAMAQRRHITAIGLDVFEEEPLPADSPLRTLDNAVLTPHTVGHTRETIEQLPKIGTQNVLRVLNGQPPLYVRNPEILQRWMHRWTNSERLP